MENAAARFFVLRKKTRVPKKQQFLASLPVYVRAEIASYVTIVDWLSIIETSKSSYDAFAVDVVLQVYGVFVTSDAKPQQVVIAAYNFTRDWWALKTAGNTKKEKEQPLLVPLRQFHLLRCCACRNRPSNPQKRRELLLKCLEAEHCELRADSTLCSGYIKGTLDDQTAPQVAATMACMSHLFDNYGPRGYSRFHNEITNYAYQRKWSTNCTWHEAGKYARSIQWNDDDDEDQDESENSYEANIECWSCGGLGHTRDECFWR